jgi:pimeloyl-ACP methyl ester carboxylesterase
MWSEPASGRRSGQEIAADLDHTLAAAGIDGPYVLVGHSMGGPYAMIFAKRVGKRVAGLVLVDATHPRQDARLSAIVEKPWYAHALQRGFMRTGWTGVPRLLSDAGDTENPAAVAFEARSMAAAADEMDASEETLREADDAHELGALPLVVMTGLAPRPAQRLRATRMSAEQDADWRAVWLELQRDQATWSSASRHVILEDSGHYIQATKPEAVVEAIRQVVDQVRSGGGWCSPV